MPKLNSLTSFRFAAALMVYLSHTFGFFNDYQFGYAAVSFFFVLSGFIMVYNYHHKFTKLNRDNMRKFYIARIGKIFPVHLLTLLLSIPYLVLKPMVFDTSPLPIIDLLIGFLLNLFMIQSFVPLSFGSTPHQFNLVSWSLSDELFFYVMFPILAYILIKLKLNKQISSSLLAVILFFSVVIGISIINVTLREIKADDWFFCIFPVFRISDFIMGALIGMVFVRKQTDNKTIRKSLFSFLEFFALILLVGWLMLSPHVNQVFRFSLYYVPIWCFLIYIFAFQAGILSKFLSHKWLVFLGEISFSFYMIHYLVVNYVGLLPLKNTLNHLVTFCGSLLASIVIYQNFEEPFRKRIRAFRSKQTNVEYKTDSPVVEGVLHE